MKKTPFVNPIFYLANLNNKLYQPRKLSQNLLLNKKPKKDISTNFVKAIEPPIIFCRNTILLPHALGSTFLVHNGLVYLKILVSENIIGHKLGEFSQTRKRYFYKNSKNKKKNRR